MFLKVQNVHFAYNGTHRVLADISFNIAKGETLCVLGASGSGKSTLLKIIAGLLPRHVSDSYKGMVEFDNGGIDALKASGGLAYMFQEAALMNNQTVKANIEFPLKLLKQSPYTSIEDTIKIVGLTNSTDKYPKELSGGMKTRTALARSFVTRPELLLLDEPFSALDLGWKNTLHQELKTLQRRDVTTTIIVTHDVEEALDIANKILILSHSGKILRTFDTTRDDKEMIASIASKIIIEDHQASVVL